MNPMTPKGRKRNHVGTYDTEEGTHRFVGNPYQGKEFYETFCPGQKVYLVYNEDSQACYVEANL